MNSDTKPAKNVQRVKDEHIIEQYAPVALLVLLGVIAFLIIRPFFVTLLTGGIIAYMFYPLFKKVRSRFFKTNWVPALLITLLFILILVIPSYFIVETVGKEISVLSILTRQYITRGSPFARACQDSGSGFACRLDSGYESLTKNPETLYYIQQGVERVRTSLIEKGSELIVGIPSMLAHFGIVILTLFFFLKDYGSITAGLHKYIPLTEVKKAFVFKRFNDLFSSVVYGNIITAFIQGCIAAIGLLIFGYPSPMVWGIMTVFAAFIPIVGTALIYVPLSLVQILIGLAESDSTVLTRGIGFLLYGAIIVSNIDNVIRMKVIGDRASIHPLFVLIGVFGGLTFFGFVGIFIGPIILSLLFTFADLSLAPLHEQKRTFLEEHHTKK